MISTLSAAKTPCLWESSRGKAVPVAARIVYALEPAVAALCLIVLAPFIAILAAIIYAASGAPPLIAHRRVGRHGRTLWVYKLRTMWPHQAHGPRSGLVERIVEEKPKTKSGSDPRVTPGLASFCRRHSIDELPQLALVAVGRMSIVGPRPITRFELHEYYDLDAAEVLSFKPGITGLWQVRGRSRLTYEQRKRFDQFFVRRYSLSLYFRIVLLTIPDLVFPRNAW
jgi:exopolysaccharide production protein ExoY